MDAKTPSRSRKIAYEAFLNFLKEGRYLNQQVLDPFSKHLTYGACQELLALEKFSKPVRPKKVKERAILFLSLYEHFFMQTAPYALVSDWVELAKQETHLTFSSFLNQYLRKLPKEFPYTDYDSFPSSFIEKLKKFTDPKPLLKIFNQPSEVFVRDRESKSFIKVKEIESYLEGSRYYIQNPTPFYLIEEALKKIPEPHTVLDLCANPGGKSIAVNEIFPNAKLYINDIKDLEQIRDNFSRLNIQAESMTQGDARDYPISEFDLVILDVPCSNTGVLHKRPEARHRLSDENLKEIKQLQTSLVESAFKHVKKGGYLFFITCSILPEENEVPYPKIWEKLILPSEEGLDGGYISLIWKEA